MFCLDSILPNGTKHEDDEAQEDLLSFFHDTHQPYETGPLDTSVQYFIEGYKLRAHQGYARQWMAGQELEKAKRFGGILADEMGCGILGPCYLFDANICAHSLGKTPQMIVRIMDHIITQRQIARNMDDQSQRTTL